MNPPLKYHLTAEAPKNLTAKAERTGGFIPSIARYSRVAMFGLGIGLAGPAFLSTGCATIGKQINRSITSPSETAHAAYREKNYLEARNMMKTIPESKLTESDKELMAKIERGIQGKLKFFLEQTTIFEGGSAMENNYVEVLEYYELAYEYMPSDHPLRSGVKKRIDDLKKLIEDLQKQYDEAETVVNSLSKEDNLISENRYIKLAANIYNMQKNAVQLNIDNTRELSDLCIQFAVYFSERGEEKQAILFFEMAKRLNQRIIPGKEDKDKFASSTVALKEAERELEVDKLRKYADEFIELYANKKNPDRKRLLELAYEILDSPYKTDLKSDTLIVDANTVKREEERKISEAKKQADARARAANRIRIQKEAERKKLELERATRLIVDPPSQPVVLPVKPTEKSGNADLIQSAYGECRRLRQLEEETGINQCKQTLLMDLSLEERQNVERWLWELINIYK